MKKLIQKSLKFLTLSSIIISMFACVKPKTTDNPLDPAKFFNITYMTILYKAPTDSNWYPVQGEFLMKFNQSQDDQKTDGTFTMHYSSYLEANFCAYGLNCVCSGGLDGTFIPQDPKANQAAANPAPYNPNDKYTPESGGADTAVDPLGEIDPTTGQPKVSQIYTFDFNISISNKSLSSGCKPEGNRTIRVLRFSNGHIIITNDYRNQYLIPQVNSTH